MLLSVPTLSEPSSYPVVNDQLGLHFHARIDWLDRLHDTASALYVAMTTETRVLVGEHSLPKELQSSGKQIWARAGVSLIVQPALYAFRSRHLFVLQRQCHNLRNIALITSHTRITVPWR